MELRHILILGFLLVLAGMLVIAYGMLRVAERARVGGGGIVVLSFLRAF